MKQALKQVAKPSEVSMIALDMDDLDMEIKDLRLQKLNLHTGGFKSPMKTLDFEKTIRRSD